MAFFNESLNNQLYIASSTSNDKGFAAFLLPKVTQPEQSGYDINEALTDSSLNGSFILSAYTPDIDTKEKTDKFVNKLLSILGTGRYIIWITDLNDFSATKNTIFMYIAGDGSASIQGLTVPLVTGISLQILNGIKLTATNNSITLGVEGGTGAKIQFTGPDAPDPNKSSTPLGNIPLTGNFRGCITFSLFIARYSLSKSFYWGFQMLIPIKNNPNQKALSEYLSLASGNAPSSSDAIGFNITVDPSDIFNQAFDLEKVPGSKISEQYNSRRTVFNFTGNNQGKDQTILVSNYVTTRGATINLIPSLDNSGNLPARLVFNNGEQYSSNAQKKHLSPEGDFIIQIEGAKEDEQVQVQCGLQATEFFNIQPQTSKNPGDKMRFIGNQPAYAPVYPLPQSSPVTAPVDPDAPLLVSDYKTSWCTIIKDSKNKDTSYVAQPKGSAFYGSNSNANPTIIGHSAPNFTFDANDVTLFPMFPYSAVVPDSNGYDYFSLKEIENFEKTFISPVRKQNINSIILSAQQKARSVFKASAADNTPVVKTVTTPSGLIAGLIGSDNNPVWQSINLAQNSQSGTFTKMFFEYPDDKLIQAFQTSDLFLVIANNENLGTAVNQGATESNTDEPKFYNKMFIGDWAMQANTGTQNKYNNYNNIIIVKGKQGKLYDPKDIDNSLVTNWQKWSAKETFASPSYINTKNELCKPDASQLVILSQWMQSYFEKASKQTDTEYFGNFNSIAKDENWTGILILGMNISTLPSNLNGVLSGVRYPDLFRTHHFGINITPVHQGDSGPEVKSPSSMFGLIYYNDPEFIQKEPPEPIQPNLTETYDFTLLNLKVLFENTSVKSFQSYAQLTTNNYFGSAVDHMGDGGNSFNTMILKGSLQFKGNEALYSLGTTKVNTFYFNSPIVNKIEISNASFSTIGINSDGKLVSRFTLNGIWDFKELSVPGSMESPGNSFDILSFGNTKNEDKPLKGLLFNSLGIQVVSEQYTPGQTEPLKKTMTVDTSSMTFDPGRSTPRQESIYINFALNLQNLVQGDTKTKPSDKDFLTVITDLKVSPIDGTPWVGLSYRLNMGTPGELAGNVGLTSTLLVAWDPTAKNKTGTAPPVLVGIKLPGTGGGAKLISLQSVLKLSIGQIRLSFAQEQSSFLMMFTEIALKFLGMLKIPPNGSSLFYLFGNPKSDGKASGLGWYAMYKKDKTKALV